MDRGSSALQDSRASALMLKRRAANIHVLNPLPGPLDALPRQATDCGQSECRSDWSTEMPSLVCRFSMKGFSWIDPPC